MGSEGRPVQISHHSRNIFFLALSLSHANARAEAVLDPSNGDATQKIHEREE